MNDNNESNIPKIKHCKFNQSSSCFIVTTDHGFITYDTNPCVKRLYRAISFKNDNDKLQSSMHYKTEWTFLVSGSCLYIWDDRKENVVSQMKFSKDILAIEQTRTCIVLAFSTEVHIYNLEDKQLIATYDTNILEQTNPKCLSVSYYNDRTFVAFPSSDAGYLTLVEIQHSSILERQDNNENDIMDTSCKFVKKLQIKRQHWDIKAHENNVTCISISNNGENMATASERGTMIRIWRTSTRDCMVEFRRGSAPTKITNISWNYTNTHVLAASERGTIHVFHAKSEDENQKSMFHWASGVLPGYFGSIWSRNKIDCNQFWDDGTDLQHCIVSFADDVLYNKNESTIVCVLSPTTNKLWRFVLNTTDNVIVKSDFINLTEDLLELRNSKFQIKI